MVELMKVTGENLDTVMELQVDPSQEVLGHVLIGFVDSEIIQGNSILAIKQTAK